MNTLSLERTGAVRKPLVEFLVACLVDSQWQAFNLVSHLQSVTQSGGDVSILFASRNLSSLVDLETAPVMAHLEEATGGLARLDVPSLGLYLGSGRMGDAFRDFAQSSFDDDVTRPLKIVGIPRAQCAQFARRLIDGEILLTVHSIQLSHAILADKVFRQTGVDDVVVSSLISRSAEIASIQCPVRRTVAAGSLNAPLDRGPWKL